MREIIFKERFLDSLLEIESYLNQFISSEKARKFPIDVMEFILEIIQKNPFAFIQFKNKLIENENVRKAVFKSNYIIVYEVDSQHITILNIYHTSRDPDSILI